jgi:hypothetical protein
MATRRERRSGTRTWRHPTGRRFAVHNPDDYGYLLSATYRRPVPTRLAPVFGTEHLHLARDNVTAPRFCILDMKHSSVPNAAACRDCLTHGLTPRALPSRPEAVLEGL